MGQARNNDLISCSIAMRVETDVSHSTVKIAGKQINGGFVQETIEVPRQK